MLEVVPALFGLLGIGWIYAGQVKIGVWLLGGGVAFWVLTIVAAIVTVGCALMVAPLLWLVAIVASAIKLHQHMQSEPGIFV